MNKMNDEKQARIDELVKAYVSGIMADPEYCGTKEQTAKNAYDLAEAIEREREKRIGYYR